MKTEVRISVRSYPVSIRDNRTGNVIKDVIVLDKNRLQAAGLLGMGDKDIIRRLYNRNGFSVLEVGQPVKRELIVDLVGLKVVTAQTADQLPGAGEGEA